MRHYVYRLEDPITKEFYIGSRSCNCEISDDVYMGSYVTWKPEDKARLIKTILKSNFRKRETATKYEKKLIKETIDYPLNRNYHIPTSGFHVIGVPRSVEVRKKISDATKGRVVSGDTRKKMSNSKLGIPLSDSHKRNIGNVQRDIPRTSETRNKISQSLMGHVVSDTTRKKQSVSHMGYVPTKQQCDAISKANTGKVRDENALANYRMAQQNRSEETRKKLSLALTGYKQIIKTCPHCGKQGGVNGMTRYHFDNCKLQKHKTYKK